MEEWPNWRGTYFSQKGKIKMRDKQIERNRLNIPGFFIKSAKNQSCDSSCTLGIIAQGLDVVSENYGEGWPASRINLSAALDIPEKELCKVEIIHDRLKGENYNRQWSRKKIHRKAYQYLITKHGFPL